MQSLHPGLHDSATVLVPVIDFNDCHAYARVHEVNAIWVTQQ